MHVVVIGAGIVGVTIAEAIAQRGVRVTLLDRRGPGLGASQASAGILAPFSEAHAGSPLLELGAASLELYDDFVRRLSTTSGRPIEYARTGTIDVALDAAALARLAKRRDELDTIGVASELVTGAAQQRLEPAISSSAAGALLIPSHGFVGVMSLIEAALESAQRAGAICEWSSDVTAIEPRSEDVTVRASSGDYVGDVVVLASGSWSSRVTITGVPALPVRPVRGQLLHLRWPDAQPPARVVWGPGCYVVPWRDGRVLVGATMEEVGFDERSTTEAVDALTSSVHALLPRSEKATLESVRVGLRPALPDELPAIGRFAGTPRVVVATGHFRNGVLLAPLTADLVARLIVDGTEDAMLAEVSPDRRPGS